MTPPRPLVLKSRRTKIVATVGPACSSAEMVERLIRAGVNVFRLNLSHGEHDLQRDAYETIRATAAALGQPIAILADLCGPKIRVGRFPSGPIELVAGQSVVVTTRNVPGAPGLIPSQYVDLANDVRPGDQILLDDGLLELRVEAVQGTEISCRVVNGGLLKDRKGMNLPNVLVSAPALTDKDRIDARFAVDLGVDWIALSFVRRPDEIEDLRRLIVDQGGNTPIIAKIEKPEAVDAIDEILEAADGLMVAHGDLGVEMPPETVPIIQQELVVKAHHRAKPVIVATQMLESMIQNPRPTRAEVSDVSHAVFSGADAVMLSAETSVGLYPVKAVEMMDRVARQVEGWQSLEGSFRSITAGEALHTAPLPLREAVAQIHGAAFARLGGARGGRAHQRRHFGPDRSEYSAFSAHCRADDGTAHRPAVEPTLGRGAATNRCERIRESGGRRAARGPRVGSCHGGAIYPTARGLR